MTENYQLKQQIQQTSAVEALKAAVQTIRKTGYFGCNQCPIYFEWPTANDLLNMPKNISIKLAELKHKIYSHSNADAFGAFKVILSNGISLPIFIPTVKMTKA